MSHSDFALSACIVILLPGCFPGFDYNTQSFAAGEATSLSGRQLYFNAEDFGTVKTSLVPHYLRFVSERTTLPVDPADHDTIDFSQADPFELTLPDGVYAAYFGEPYTTLYIGSDGTIAFGTRGTGNGNLLDYFSSNQISLLPVDATVEGARITYAIYDYNIVVTFENVSGSTFQCELFLLGWQFYNIAVTYTVVSENTRAGVVGLADHHWLGHGEGGVEGFLERSYVESNLTESTLRTNTETLKLGL